LQEEAIEIEKIQEIISEFFEFSNTYLKRSSRSISQTEAESILINRVSKIEFVALALEPNSGEVLIETEILTSDDDSRKNEKRDNYLFSKFVLEIIKTDVDKFNFLLKIINSALLTEVVLNLQNPDVKADSFSGLKIFLDGPLILDALGLGGDEALKEYALELIKQLIDNSAQVYIFPHTLLEIERVMSSTLDNHSRGNSYGPLARQLRIDPTMRTYVRTLQTNLTDSISRIRVKVFNTAELETEKRLSYFSKEQESALASTFPYNLGTDLRHERDASSIAYVIRLRGAEAVVSLHSSKFLGLQEN